ncbi:hypothetical protein ABK040_007751 [Willaertia magna]
MLPLSDSSSSKRKKLNKGDNSSSSSSTGGISASVGSSSSSNSEQNEWPTQDEEEEIILQSLQNNEKKDYNKKKIVKPNQPLTMENVKRVIYEHVRKISTNEITPNSLPTFTKQLFRYRDKVKPEEYDAFEKRCYKQFHRIMNHMFGKTNIQFYRESLCNEIRDPFFITQIYGYRCKCSEIADKDIIITKSYELVPLPQKEIDRGLVKQSVDFFLILQHLLLKHFLDILKFIEAQDLEEK